MDGHPAIFRAQCQVLVLESQQCFPKALIVDPKTVAQDSAQQRFVGMPQEGQGTFFEG